MMELPWLTASREQFFNQMRSGRQAHAVLVSGPAGLGKAVLAGEMAQSLLCLEPADSNGAACGTCRSCQFFRSGAHPDFRRVTFIPREKSDELRTVIIVDQIRELIGSLQLTNGLSPRKVAIIHPAEAMNRSAANALLKTLEEPAGEVVIILVSHDPSRLGATIRSRCQSVHVRSPGQVEAEKWVMQQSGVDSQHAGQALLASAGSPLGAVELLESGRAQEFSRVLEQLETLLGRSEAVLGATDVLSALDPDELWNWLGVASAKWMREGLGVSRDRNDISSPIQSSNMLKHFAELHRKANRNQRLMSTTVRKDFLLRDWLIQWSSPTSS